MKTVHMALLAATLGFCAISATPQTMPDPPAPGASATQRRAPPDPGILERPPAHMDPQAIERPPQNVDPGLVERPPRAASQSGESDGKNRKVVPPPPGATGGPDLPSVIVVPHGRAMDKNLGKGCWVQFYEEKAYRGRSLTLVGPAQMPKMNISGGLWVNWSSAVVGPNATVTTFDYEQFKNRTAVLRPGQRIPNLRDRELGRAEDIHSLQIKCGTGRRR